MVAKSSSLFSFYCYDREKTNTTNNSKIDNSQMKYFRIIFMLVLINVSSALFASTAVDGQSNAEFYYK